MLNGRKLELLRRDDESIPAKGVIAARELYFKEKVAVLIGGLDTPVAVAIVPIANESRLPFMDPWAAGTAITKNGAKDNYVFRVSAVDELVDKAMFVGASLTPVTSTRQKRRTITPSRASPKTGCATTCAGAA